MRTLIDNIKKLIQVEGLERKPRVNGKDMKLLPEIDNAWLLIEDGIIHSFGEMQHIPENIIADKVIDATGRMVLPSWCDSHTHLVFAAPREQEFVDRINGMTYAEIAARGGGILNSANR
jgi:imidazolonepropionase